MPGTAIPYPPDEPSGAAPEDLLGMTPAESERAMVAGDAVAQLEGRDVSATMSAIASAHASTLHATGSAIGVAGIEGGLNGQFSAIGIAAAQRDSSVHQSCIGVVAASGDCSASQSVVPVVLARKIGFEHSAAGVAVAGKAKVDRGFVGILVAPRVSLTGGSRVLLDGKALAAIALALTGGLGLIALAIWLSAQRLTRLRWGR